MQEKKRASKGTIILGAVAILFVILIVAGVSGSGKVENETTKTTSGTDNSWVEGETNLTVSAIEHECEDAKYGTSGNGRSVINVWDYNLNIYPFSYDKDGNQLLQVVWNGKNSDGDTIQFKCYISGASDDDLTVYYIAAGSEDVWKSQTDLHYNVYSSDGEPEYPDLH